jgi:hypothetical protein
MRPQDSHRVSETPVPGETDVGRVMKQPWQTRSRTTATALP